jgi:hypothetical protein
MKLVDDLLHYLTPLNVSLQSSLVVLRRNLFSSRRYPKKLAKNPVFEVISLHGPSGSATISVHLEGFHRDIAV